MSLTKTLAFDDATLEVIRDMTWSDDGTVGTLPPGQLEHKLYEKVNKALEAMGGKWNRKVGGHIFPTDPRPNVEGLLADGELLVERDGFFETPQPVARRMVAMLGLQPDWRVLEPEAGLGAIAREILAAGVHPSGLTCVEKNIDRAKALYEAGFNVDGVDFLEFWAVGWDAIVMNPPFEEGQDVEHIQHAFGLLKPGRSMTALTSNSWTFRNDKKYKEFREWLDEEVPAHTVETLPSGTFKESGTMIETRLLKLTKPY